MTDLHFAEHLEQPLTDFIKVCHQGTCSKHNMWAVLSISSLSEWTDWSILSGQWISKVAQGHSEHTHSFISWNDS